MSFLLMAQTEPARGLLPFLRENWLLLVPPVFGFVAIYLLLPRARRMKPLVGIVLAAFAMGAGAALLVRLDTNTIEAILFYAFAGIAIGAGAMMITQANPVHAALSFALVVLSSCGLFLLQAAPFLMAATIIVYAGAIVVTFLFVIMLARQEGASNADQRSREPFLASLAGCLLLASLVCILHKSTASGGLETYATRGLEGAVRDLKELSEAKDDADVKRILGDPRKAEVGNLTRPLVDKLQKQFPEGKIKDESSNLQQAWVKMNVPMIRTKARLLYESLSVPGKVGAPGHYEPGKLPAMNVAAIGRTLFTDYLIGVELVAVLLLVATIGAIVIAGRKVEELR